MAGPRQQSQEGAAKEMTRQHIDCFSLYGNATRFIKNCFTYSCDKHTDTSHTGSHQHYEPVNIMPKIGWASSILPNKLEGVNPRSMGAPDCGWIPTRTYNNSLSEACASSSKVCTREQDPNNYRGLGTSGQKGNCGCTAFTTELCVSDLPGSKKGWGSETSNKPKGSQSICEDRTLQGGRSSPTPRSFTTTGLDGKDGPEGCLSPDPYSSRLPTPPYLPVGGEDLHVPIPTLWPLSSTQSVYKTAKASGGFSQTDWLSSHSIPGRYPNITSGQGSATTSGPINLSAFRESGVDGEPHKIHIDAHPRTRVSRFPSELGDNEAYNSFRETPENPAGCQAHAGPTVRVSEGNSEVCGQDHCYPESHSISPIALQGSPVANELSPSPEFLPEGHAGGDTQQIRDNSITEPSLQGRLGVVDSPRKGSSWSTSVSPRPDSISALRCIQQGLGCSAEWLVTDRSLWSPEEATHHINYLELLAAFLALKAFGKAWQNITVLLRMDNITAVSYINQKGGTVSQELSASVDSLDLVCREEHNSHSRASARSAELAG